MSNIKEGLKERINGWYKNSEIDYGITGGFVDCKTSGNKLIIYFQEDGKSLTCEICWYQEYNAEQLYNIWMESEWEKAEESTLVNHLLCWGYDPEDYLDTLDRIETAIKDKEYLAEHPEEANEEAQYIDDDIADWEEELKGMREDWKPEKELNMDEEIELIRKWVKERQIREIEENSKKLLKIGDRRK